MLTPDSVVLKRGIETAVQRCLKKRCSKNMQQDYRRTPMRKCDFNKVAKQLYRNHKSACKFAAYFQNTFSFTCPVLLEISSYQMILKKRKKLVITGRSGRDIYINVKKQLGRGEFMNTWQLSQRETGIILVKNKNQ